MGLDPETQRNSATRTELVRIAVTRDQFAKEKTLEGIAITCGVSESQVSRILRKEGYRKVKPS